MNWATRCPSCATVFRVAEDQLRVSDGFVRCGRCDAVFDARAQLFDLVTGEALQPAFAPAPPATPIVPPFAPPTPQPAPAPSPALEPGPLEPDPDPAWLPPPPEAPTGQRKTEPRFAATEWPQTHVDEPEPTLPPDCAYTAAVEAAAGQGVSVASTPSGLDTPVAQASQRMRELLGEPGEALSEDTRPVSAPNPFASLEARPPPSRWRRAAGWLGLSALALALPLQWAWIERDTLRAQWPALEMVWQKACSGCEPVLLTRLDGLVVASSSLQPTPQGQAYQLQLRVENRAPHALRLPWVDLQLSDEAGRRLLRRSLSPTELGQQSPRLEAGASVNLQATFKLDGRLAGYEVGLFHP